MLAAAATAFYVAMWATAVVMVPTSWLGWVLARKDLPSWAVALCWLPVLVPPGAVPAGSMVERVAGAALLAFPLGLLAARAAFVRVGPRWGQLARALGDAPGAVFAGVDLPLAFPGILAAGALCFARAASIDLSGLPVAIPALLVWASLTRTHHQALEAAGG